MVKRGKTELIITVFITSGAFSSIIAAIDFFTGTNYGPILSGAPQNQFGGRYAGPEYHPNALGYFLVLTTLLTVYKLLIARESKKNAGYIFIVLISLFFQGLGIYLSGSVAAYLGLLFGLVSLVYANVSSRIRKAIIFSGYLLVIAVLLIGIIWISDINITLLGIPESSLIGKGINRVINSTARSRIDLYNLSIDYIVQSPLIGAGFDQSASSVVPVETRLLPGSIHNTFLQSWYMGGLFAFLGWLIVHFYIGKIAVVNLFRQSNNQYILINALSAACIAILFMDLTTNAITQREKWLVVGLLVSCTWMNNHLSKIYRSQFS